MSELWGIHIYGPDKIYPAPSRAEAEAKAAELNAFLQSVGAQPANDDLTPSLLVVAERWKGSPESHAAGLAEWAA